MDDEGGAREGLGEGFDGANSEGEGAIEAARVAEVG